MQVDLQENKFSDLAHVENSPAYASEPAIYFDESNADSRTAFLNILQWIRNGNNARAKEIRVQAAFYYLSGGSRLSSKTQSILAREVGATKAAISQKAVELHDYFAAKLGLKDTFERVSVAVGMRTSKSRQKFSEVCKSNHQKRKSSLNSNGSPTKSTASTQKPLSLREKVTTAGGLP